LCSDKNFSAFLIISDRDNLLFPFLSFRFYSFFYTITIEFLAETSRPRIEAFTGISLLLSDQATLVIIVFLIYL